jgi:hypothetical protein
MKNVVKQMEDARALANGTMEIYVTFKTQEEIDLAEEWMKGKQKVKNISVGFPTKPFWERSDHV